VSLDMLLAHLTQTAEQEVEVLLNAARERALAIDRESAERIARRRETELARLADEKRRAVARETAAAEQDHLRTVLQERARVLEQVMEQAATRLGIMSAPKYAAAVPKLLASSLKYLEGLPAVVQCRPDAAPLVRELCRTLPEVRVQPDDAVPAGIRAESADGGILVDNTLPALLSLWRDELSVSLAARLEEARP
jgi:vacuolar-type H+-ATPase subunit E/Vma4